MMRSSLLLLYPLSLCTGIGLTLACGGETTSSGATGNAGTAGNASGAGGSAGNGSDGSTMTGGAGGSGGATGGSTGGGGATGGAAGNGDSGPSTCPSSPPPAGSRCVPPWGSASPPAAHCAWGDDPRAECRTTARCINGSWELSAPKPICSMPPLPPSCAAPPPPNTTPCSDATLSCWYDDGVRCRCSNCQGGLEYPICRPIDPPEWYCDRPPATCPTKIPQAGAPCSTPGASCGRDCDLIVRCDGGVWQWIEGACPICASPDTPLATPDGERPIASLDAGDLVYSVDHDAIVAVPLLRIGRTPVVDHWVMRVVLDNAVLHMSPGHPTADGRPFGELRAGSALDPQHIVNSAALVPYAYDATYDVLPASDTGTYFAAGALVRSTLFGAVAEAAVQPRHRRDEATPVKVWRTRATPDFGR